MAEIVKALTDDHLRVKRMFNDYMMTPWDMSEALAICDELTIHSRIEEQIVYPALRDIDERAADHAEDEHAELAEMIDRVRSMEPDDPSLERTMRRMQLALQRHVAEEESQVFPVLDRHLRRDSLDMGRQAFAMRQELLAAKAKAENSGARRSASTANVGWGGSRRRKGATANTGW